MTRTCFFRGGKINNQIGACLIQAVFSMYNVCDWLFIAGHAIRFIFDCSFPNFCIISRKLNLQKVCVSSEFFNPRKWTIQLGFHNVSVTLSSFFASFFLIRNHLPIFIFLKFIYRNDEFDSFYETRSQYSIFISWCCQTGFDTFITFFYP